MPRIKSLTKNFIADLVALSAGRINPETFDSFFSLIEKETLHHYFTDTSESNLLRMLKAQYDLVFFINESIKYPHHIEILVTIASNSNYLSDILVVNPEFFYFIVNPSSLSSKLNYEQLEKELKNKISKYNSLDAKVRSIKTIKRREILRTGLKDIFNKAEVEEITEELSVLASCLTAELFSVCYQFILNKYEITTERSYCIISLGKLGGNELNYSSDIDLIIFYDEDEKINSRYYSELLLEVIKLFLEKSSLLEGGFLYRIDLRLRPDGKSSSVCRSINEYLEYYESRGNDWERQMLIKAGFLAGDKNLYNKFIKYLDSFVYPVSLHYSPLEQVIRLKKIIEEKLKGENIKLIPGGIRDIEFIVQGLQLLNAGKNPSLKTGNSLEAISKLRGANFLTENETNTLSSSYKFYRQVEHYLQLMNNAQTHVIPEEGEIAEKLSWFLGFNSLKDFRKEIDKKKKRVRTIYNSFAGRKEKERSKNIESIPFANQKNAENNLSFLKEGKGLTSNRQFDKRTIEAFSKIGNELLNYLRNSKQPDKILDNFVRIIRFADFPSIWYREFYDKEFFQLFLRICEFSQKSIDLMSDDEELRELFLSRNALNESTSSESENISLKKILFKISVQLTINLISAEEASSILSKAVINKINKAATDFSNKKKWEKNYFTAVLGSTGTGEMTFNSDVDLVFAVKEISRFQKAEKDFQDLLSVIRKELLPLNVDCRLRPEGKSSQLVWDLESYKKYYAARAQVWELQSFSKIKFAAGNKRLFNSLKNSFLKSVQRFSKEEIRKGMIEIRSKALSSIPFELKLIDLKRSAGGLGDIEYSVHFLLLSNTVLIKDNFGNSIEQVIQSVKKEKKNINILNQLCVNYIFIHKLILFNQLLTGSSSYKVSRENINFEILSSSLGINGSTKLKNMLDAALKSTRESFTKLLKIR